MCCTYQFSGRNFRNDRINHIKNYYVVKRSKRRVIQGEGLYVLFVRNTYVNGKMGYARTKSRAKASN